MAARTVTEFFSTDGLWPSAASDWAKFVRWPSHRVGLRRLDSPALKLRLDPGPSWSRDSAGPLWRIALVGGLLLPGSPRLKRVCLAAVWAPEPFLLCSPPQPAGGAALCPACPPGGGAAAPISRSPQELTLAPQFLPAQPATQRLGRTPGTAALGPVQLGPAAVGPWGGVGGFFPPKKKKPRPPPPAQPNWASTAPPCCSP